MGQLAADVLATLRTAAASGVLGEDVERAVTVAADLLARVRSPNYRSGIPEVDAAAVTEAEGRELEQALQDLLRRHPRAGLASSLIWALGKVRDPANAGEFTAQLERGVRLLLEGNRLVFQALCALDDVGEDVFERDDRGCSSQGLTEVEKNLRQARVYLSARGIQVPW